MPQLYQTLGVEDNKQTPPYLKVVGITLVVLGCAILFYVLKSDDGDPGNDVRYNSIAKGGLYGINETLSNININEEIILKRPVILLPQPKLKVPFKLVCYYSIPFNETDLQPEMIQDVCTHINIAFAGIDAFNYSILLSMQNLHIIKQLESLRVKRKDLKLLISVGGAGPSNFKIMVESHVHRKLFIRSLMSLLKSHNLDGVDLDWEWPAVEGGVKQRVKFAQLLQEIRREFDLHKRKYLLSVAVAAVESIIDLAYYIEHMAQNVDYVNIMGYDYHYFATYYPVTDHNAPLYPSLKDKGYLAALNVNYSVHYWVAQGMPREKIVLGLPTFGHSYTLYNWVNHDLHAPASGPGSVGEAGSVSYSASCQFLDRPSTSKVWDAEAGVPYAFDYVNWVSYDDVQSLQLKAQYILDEGLAGAMTWSLNNDDFSGSCHGSGVTFPLHRAVQAVLET